jgi:hypothetical protein
MYVDVAIHAEYLDVIPFEHRQQLYSFDHFENRGHDRDRGACLPVFYTPSHLNPMEMDSIPTVCSRELRLLEMEPPIQQHRSCDHQTTHKHAYTARSICMRILRYRHFFSLDTSLFDTMVAHFEVWDHYADVGHHLVVRVAPGFVQKYVI